MLPLFDTYGLFYKNNNKDSCRKYVNIIRKDPRVTSPDLMIVMVNPGSSKPKDKNYNNSEEAETISDRTLDQIKIVMDKCDFNYARVLNLSDLKTETLDDFYIKLDGLEYTSHSIFSDERVEDFENLFVKNVPVLVAWGIRVEENEKAKKIAENAIGKINNKNIDGWLKEGTKFSYYHPLVVPYGTWVERITEILGNIKH